MYLEDLVWGREEDERRRRPKRVRPPRRRHPLVDRAVRLICRLLALR